jgi:hypothetical protein
MKDIRRGRAEFTQADHEYFARLRQELAKGPFGMCDALEYAPLDEYEKRIEAALAEKRERKRPEYGTVHGSDIRRVDD